MRAAPLLLLLLVTACGTSATAPESDQVLRPADAAAAPAVGLGDDDQLQARLAAVPEQVRAAGSVRYAGVVESGLDAEPSEVEARLAGVLDTVAGAGTADLDLVGLAELADLAPEGDEAAAAELAALSRFRLSWTPEQLTVEVDGHRESVPRDADDDLDGAMVERVPGEPAGLLEVVAATTDVTVVGPEQVDGVPSTRLRGEVAPAAAVAAGLGAQAQLTLAQLPSLPVDVWLDGQGRPVRIRYTAEVPSVQQGRTRTMTATYDYRDWGQPVDVTP